MSEIADRYRKVAAGFTERARSVPDGAWDNPTPCEGWVARDVVRHMIEWMPGLTLGNAGVELPEGPSVDDDPVGAWQVFSDTVQAAVDAPDIAGRGFDLGPEHFTLEGAVAHFCIGDVLVHTWDLARATGLDERLDADEVHRLLAAMMPAEAAMRASVHYGARVDVPADADEQTKLIAFTGRQP